MEKSYKAKLALLASFVLIFGISCQKELSHEKGCGTVYKIDALHAYIAYPDGSISMAKKDSTYFIGKKICK